MDHYPSQVHRDIPLSSQCVALRSPRLTATSTPRRTQQLDTASSLSPVAVETMEGVASMDIGSSPPPVTRGFYDGDASTETKFPKTVSHAMPPNDNSITQLSDLSGEHCAAEDRLYELDSQSIHALLNRGMYERTVPFEKNSTPNTSFFEVPQTKDDEGIPVAAKGFSLVTMQQNMILPPEQRRPLVSVAIEVATGVTDYIKLFEGDTYDDCRIYAMELVDKFGLDQELALDALEDHLCRTLDEYMQQVSSTSQQHPLAVESRPQKGQQGTVGQRPNNTAVKSQTSSTTAARSGRPGIPTPSSASTNGRVPARSPQRRPVSTVSPTRSATSQQRSTSSQARRPESPDVAAMLASNGSSFQHVSARYMSPAPERPPPPVPHHTHTPQVTRMAHQLGTSSQPAHQRLFKKGAAIETKRQESIRARNHQESIGRQQVFTNKTVAGLQWDYNRDTSKPPGDRLYEAATRQQQRHTIRTLQAVKERQDHELDGASFQPKINDPRSSSAKRYHRDPFSHEKNSATTVKVLSTAEREMLECTFNPKINNNRRVSPRPTRASSITSNTRPPPPQESQLQREHSAQRQQTPTRSPRRSPVRSPIRSFTNPAPSFEYNSSAENTSRSDAVTNRLYEGAREKQQRLERARLLAQSYDSKTGQPLFAPQILRRV